MKRKAKYKIVWDRICKEYDVYKNWSAFGIFNDWCFYFSAKTKEDAVTELQARITERNNLDITYFDKDGTEIV